jgi:Xaa-Pro aminopeptidase
MLNARAIAMQGLGRSGRLVAVQGLWPEADAGGSNVGARGSLAKRVREQYELIDEVRRKRDALRRAMALAKKQAADARELQALQEAHEVGMAAMRRAMGAIALADEAAPPSALREIATQAAAQMAVARAAFIEQLGSAVGLQRANNRRRALIAIVLLLLT